MKRFLIGMAALLFLLAAFEFAGEKISPKDSGEGGARRGEAPGETPGEKAGGEAPVLPLRTLDGTELSLADFRGKKVLLNFWASWCSPCREEIPHLQKFYRRHGGEIAVLAVNLTFGKENPETVKKFVEDHGLTFPVLLDREGKMMKEYGVVGIPTSFFIDEKGMIRRKYVGPMKEKDMDKIFRQMEESSE
ncbi:TlpA family protein disulfide reductase [Caldibacillus debilis]|uniref:TlpA family protein disulfide reductase n=1 Tax=Caldibacillus debilis TaxID=301148 RepID=UPI000369DF5A|nr:TlpA disulfide reductase family protein [Caldibacillus debilis]